MLLLVRVVSCEFLSDARSWGKILRYLDQIPPPSSSVILPKHTFGSTLKARRTYDSTMVEDSPVVWRERCIGGQRAIVGERTAGPRQRRAPPCRDDKPARSSTCHGSVENHVVPGRPR